MDRDDLVRDTYTHYGLAMFQAQVLEHGIVNAMVYAQMPDRHRITRADIDAFMGRQFEKTLRALLRELKKYVSVPADLEADLAEALRLRNHLAHDYFRERAEAFMTNAGCVAVIEQLQPWQEFFRDVSGRLTELVRPIDERFGVTAEADALSDVPERLRRPAMRDGDDLERYHARRASLASPALTVAGLVPTLAV